MLPSDDKYEDVPPAVNKAAGVVKKMVGHLPHFCNGQTSSKGIIRILREFNSHVFRTPTAPDHQPHTQPTRGPRIITTADYDAQRRLLVLGDNLGLQSPWIHIFPTLNPSRGATAGSYLLIPFFFAETPVPRRCGRKLLRTSLLVST